MAPTSAPRITRGSLICQTIAVSMGGTDRAGCHGSRTSSASPTVVRDRPAGPTDTPTTRATTSAASAIASGRPGRTRPRAVGVGPGTAWGVGPGAVSGVGSGVPAGGGLGAAGTGVPGEPEPAGPGGG